MDEPFKGVDARTEQAFIDLLQALLQEGRTVMAVRHDLATVPESFDLYYSKTLTPHLTTAVL